MKLDINVCTQSDCSVTVFDEGKPEDLGYLSSDAVVKNRFLYLDTVSIDVLLLNKIMGPEILKPVIKLREEEPKPVKLFAAFDGWFTICHIVIPNDKWFKEEKEKGDSSALGLYNRVYYSDGTNIYKYIDGVESETNVEELIEGNSEDTTISIVKKNYVSICFLRKCYINLCQLIFNSSAFSECFNKNNSNSELSYRRDLVWMALNVVQYLTEFNLLAEAERILEQLNKCNGVCKDMSASPRRGCGCS